MNELAKLIIRVEGVQTGVNRRPIDAASLLIIDQGRRPCSVLLGKRHASHVFLPCKLVFPGGRVEKIDNCAPISRTLHPDVEAKLRKNVPRSSKHSPSALAVAAIRETFEETGLIIGTKCEGASARRKPPWNEFGKLGIAPDLSLLRFVARAITPPRYPRRFDTRFFAVDRGAISHQVDLVTQTTELTAITWVPMTDALQMDIPVITGLVLTELIKRIDAGYEHHLPVPFFHMWRNELLCELL